MMRLWNTLCYCLACFLWLILIPATLVNILLTGLIYLLINSIGLGNYTNLVFLIVIGSVNWAMFFAFIWIVGRATSATTRRASAPSIRARAKAAAQLPERTSVSSGQ